MATYNTHVIVIGKTKLSDSDLILTLLAQDGSQIRAVAKGVLKPRSRMGGTLELFSVADVLIAEGRNLDIITEASGIASNLACREDLDRSAACSAVCELLCRLSLPGQEQPRLFDMTVAGLAAIGQATTPGRARLIAAASIMKTVSLLGYRPELTDCLVCGDSVDVATWFSWPRGGIVCSKCASGEPTAQEMDGALLRWVRALISSTFMELLMAEGGEQMSEALLRFAERWLCDHVDVRLRSLSVMFSL